MYLLTKGRAGEPPSRLDTSWIIETADALCDLPEEDEEGGVDPLAGLVRRAVHYTGEGVEIPTVF